MAGVGPPSLFLKVAKLFLILAVFSVDIVTNTLYPFTEGKAAFFRIATELSLIALLIHWAWKDQRSEVAARAATLFRVPLFLAVTAFAFFFVLSSIFAADTHAAFWSNLERGEGAFQILHYYLFFVLCSLLLTTDSDWKWMFRASVAAAVLMVLYGLAADVPLPGFVGIEGIPAEYGFVQRLVTMGLRFQGSLGNAAYVASYLMFSMFFSLYLWGWETRPADPRKVFGYVALILFFFSFLWLSGTRGGLLGVLAAMAGFGLYMILRSRRPGRAIAGSLFVLAAVFVVLLTIRNQPFAKAQSTRILAIGLGEGSVQFRLRAWEAAWKGFLDRPLLGWGPENFSIVFDKYFDTRYFRPEVRQTWWDRAHNVIFDYLAENGAITFLAYCSIVLSFYGMLFRKIRLDRQGAPPLKSVLHQGLLFAVPIGYLTQGLVMFDVLPIYISYFTVLAFANHAFGSRVQP